MGLFDALFRSSTPVPAVKQRPKTSIEAMEAYYYIATSVIPTRLFRDETKFFASGRSYLKSLQDDPQSVIIELMLYAQINGGLSVPTNEAGWFANNLRPLSGDIGSKFKFIIIEYPRPLPMQIGNKMSSTGPFYNAFVYSESENSIRCYVLRTKLSEKLDVGLVREILPNGIMITLGYCPSDLNSFLNFLSRVELHTKPIMGGVDKDGNTLKNPLFEIVYRYYPDARKPNTMILNDSDGNIMIPAHWRPVFEK